MFSVSLFLFYLFAFTAESAIYDAYAYPGSPYGQFGGYNSYNPLASLLNPLLSPFQSSFSWPQYGPVTPWSSGGLFGLTRASGHSDRYGGNLGYNYGCIPFCKNGIFPQK